MYDVRGLDGTGTSANPVTSGANAKTYTVRKLADGNCWMSEDLKLGGDAAVTLTSSETDLAQSSIYILSAQNTGGWCMDHTAACFDQSLMLKNGVPNGYLYNWYAATAGTGVYNTGSGINATASICPKGWKLPTGGSGGNFANLDIAYGGNGANRTDATQRNKFMASPLSFNYTGYRDGSSILQPSTYGMYWSRTAALNISAYDLRLYSDGTVAFSSHHHKYGGFAIRCVAAS